MLTHHNKHLTVNQPNVDIMYMKFNTTYMRFEFHTKYIMSSRKKAHHLLKKPLRKCDNSQIASVTLQWKARFNMVILY